MTKEREGPYNGVPVNILYERERKRDRERNCERDKEKVSLRDWGRKKEKAFQWCFFEHSISERERKKYREWNYERERKSQVEILMERDW